MEKNLNSIPQHAEQRSETISSSDAQITQLELEVEQWKDKYLRAKAEFDNARKRVENRYTAQYMKDKGSLLTDMLVVSDNLERALQHTETLSGSDGLQAGVALTLKIFLDKLALYGVHPIEVNGQQFDPDLHEAVGQVNCADCEPGSIVAVEQQGYLLGDDVLRPARVLIASD